MGWFSHQPTHPFFRGGFSPIHRCRSWGSKKATTEPFDVQLDVKLVEQQVESNFSRRSAASNLPKSLRIRFFPQKFLDFLRTFLQTIYGYIWHNIWQAESPALSGSSRLYVLRFRDSPQTNPIQGIPWASTKNAW